MNNAFFQYRAPILAVLPNANNSHRLWCEIRSIAIRTSHLKIRGITDFQKIQVRENFLLWGFVPSEIDSSSRTVNNLQGRNSRNINITGGVPCVIGTLHSNPQQRLGAKQLAEANGNLGANGLSFSENVVKVLAGNAEHSGNLCLCFASGGNNVFSQNFAGVRWATVGITAHGVALLVILFKV
ncbi:hypothetical protein [Insolitispirillum peregrinum]